MKENNISQLGDYDPPFCEQQYTHGSCYISLFKFKTFDQLIPSKLPRILDIGDLKQHDEVMRRWWSMARCLFKENHASLNTDII